MKTPAFNNGGCLCPHTCPGTCSATYTVPGKIISSLSPCVTLNLRVEGMVFEVRQAKLLFLCRMEGGSRDDEGGGQVEACQVKSPVPNHHQ